ncbi:hypothetical protein VINI7043_26620 [Vibrio nigripulchritudo ATCC 27043]|uniref:hypothetical protein n=1 Tax=Vibrio nigripulchritudo TaxID=28173 RepID=UPI00021C2A90|nr:hypothetical protein [Vibrio nigripulchritudo]EGU55371.1 hypothetical protein VINI7043_26620 [Vibrio nigripulchritudo ATCC 27043]
MEWETVNGIAGLVSAICSILGLGYFGTKRKSEIETSDHIITLPKFMAFILVSGAWALLCLCGLWIFDPFDGYMFDEDYLLFYGVVLTLPSLIIFSFGVNALRTQQQTP